MLAKLAVAVLVGALSGALAGARESPWLALPSTPPAVYAAKAVARVETAWHFLRHQRAP